MDYINSTAITNYGIAWHMQGVSNVEKWGLQDIESIMLATDEEWGEFVQAYHEATYEDADGNPLDEQKPLEDCTAEQLARIEDELADTAALLFQAQAAIERARHV